MVDDLLFLLLFVRFYERRCCFNRVVSKSKSPSCRAESRSACKRYLVTEVCVTV